MFRTLTIAVASATVLMFSPAAFAQQTGGTANEAKAMLMKAVAAVKADKAKALDMFTKGEGGFLTATSMYFAVLSVTARSSRSAIPMPSKTSV